MFSEQLWPRFPFFTASPPKQVTIDQLAEAANSFYKMSLVHEISVDSNFKMERKEEPWVNSFKWFIYFHVCYGF